MVIKFVDAPCWSTASFGHGAETSPMELSALGEHLHLCRAHTGRFFALRCRAEAMHGFMASRFVTTLVIVMAVVVGVSLLV